MKRIHIVGASPRTGTTLLAEAMRNCFDIDYATPHEDKLFTRAPGQPEVFLSKCPNDIMVVGPSLRLDPHLYVLCMIRDPRDIISSIHRKDPDKYWAGLKFWKLYSKQIPKLIHHKRFILIRYRQLVTNPNHIQDLIIRKIPFLNKIGTFDRYHETANVSNPSVKALGGVRPIRPDSVGNWMNHKSRVAGQLFIHGSISNDLIMYGYEKDNDWLDALKASEPDLNPGHFSEKMTKKDIFYLKAGRYVEALRRYIEYKIRSRIRITHPKKWFRK